MASLSRGLAPPFPPMSALQKADDPIDCLQMPEPRKKLVVDLEGDYARWRREHPPLDCEMSVNRWGSIFWLWTIIVSMAVSYNMISIPALVYIEDQETLAFWLYMNIVADVIYLLDIVVQSRLTFFSEGCEESSPIATILHYFHSKFASDVCSTVPIDLFVSYRSSFAFLRLNRLGKIGRVLELYQLAEKRWPAVVVSLSKLISLCALLFHWNACAYFYLGSFRNMNLTKGVNATFDDDVEWDWPYLPEKVTDLWTADCKLKCYGGMELVDEEREDAMMMLYQKWENRTIRWEFSPSLKEYVQSMYWSCLTITTLGEQPSPDDNTQTVFETADTLLGMVVFAAIMGSVGALVGNANRVEAERKTFMDGLKQFMSFRGVGEEMAQRVVRHCADELARGQRLHDGEVKDEVPERVFLAVNRQTALLPLALSPIFRGCGHSFLADIALKLISRRLGPGDVLAREGERHTEMYIVARGHLMLETDCETREVAEGCIVGEEGIIWLEEKPKSWKETVYSREYSQVFCLTREALFDVLEDFPHLIPILSERASRADEPILNSPRTTTEKLLSIAEDVAILGEHLDRQYEHFVVRPYFPIRRLSPHDWPSGGFLSLQAPPSSAGEQFPLATGRRAAQMAPSGAQQQQQQPPRALNRIPKGTKEPPPRTSSAPPASGATAAGNSSQNRHRVRSNKERITHSLNASASSALAAEYSMLRSITKVEEELRPIAIEGLRKHEYDDDSDTDEEEVEQRKKMKPNRARSASTSKGSSSAKAKSRGRESAPLGFIRERKGLPPASQPADPSRRLLFDPEFSVYYDPQEDSYFAISTAE